MRVIGLCGRAGSGKTTLRYELERHGWHGASFAAPIRAMLGELLRLQGIAGDEAYDLLHDHERKNDPCVALGGHTPRYAMQTLGTEWGRRIMGNVWLPLARKAIRYRRWRDEGLVFDDMRFPDEAALIREYGGLVVRIVRHAADEIKAAHESETALADIEPDLVITNADADEWTFAQRAAAEILAAMEARP